LIPEEATFPVSMSGAMESVGLVASPLVKEHVDLIPSFKAPILEHFIVLQQRALNALLDAIGPAYTYALRIVGTQYEPDSRVLIR